MGPLVRARWAVPRSVAAALAANGTPIPTPIEGFLLLDTGAGHTAIAEHVALSLGLQATGSCTSFGAHGQQESLRYMAELAIFTPPEGALTSEAQVMGIPKMKESFEKFGTRDQYGKKIDVIGLLGRAKVTTA